ncbi:MAG: hypothetical protein K5705_01950 [Oscillospiraceae bacterium]|nr:hypothetical protein [Oscillospiraceae bacterium]MCR4759032.1 hypothetical protein [Oscillospiraceae bacterium]
MDQTIRKILELDAETEDRLNASRLKCTRMLSDARKQAAAVTQAQKHQTRDTITELEEQTRSECEQKIAELRAGFDRRTEAMTKQFETQHDTLLNTLFEETLREAEA